jgi:hypothetical protein
MKLPSARGGRIMQYRYQDNRRQNTRPPDKVDFICFKVIHIFLIFNLEKYFYFNINPVFFITRKFSRM